MTETAHENLPIAKAINAGMRAAMQADQRVILMGEDIGPLGGVFRVTDGLQQEFGTARVLDTPLAEAGIVGHAIGLAMAGFRPVVEIQFDGFVFPAFSQITTQLAKLRNRSEGTIDLPVVIRLRRPHWSSRASPRKPGSLLCAHRRPASRGPRKCERCLLDDSRSH